MQQSEFCSRLGPRLLAMVPTLLALGLLAGCSLATSGKGNRLFARGDLLGAAEAYETSLAKGSADPELLFRLAVIYLSAEPQQLDEGEGLLRRLVAEDVGGPYRPAASLLLSSRRQLVASGLVRDSLQNEITGLESEVAKQSAMIKGLQGADASHGVTIEQLQGTRAQLKGRVTALQTRLASETERVRSLEAELQKLEAIDLGRPPGR